jgi:hypothetical protein
MNVIMIICAWCDGRGFHLETRDGGLYHLTCEKCNGIGHKLEYPPRSVVKIEYGREDRASE